MKLRVLDGAASIGGTKLHLEDGGTNVLLDFGLNYSTFGNFYEEFMRPRSCRGILDLWELGIIPRVGGIYRDDLMPPGWSPTCSTRLSPDALLISHGHMDHVGLIGALRSEIPLIGSPITAAILRSLQDTGKAEAWSEMAYAIPKQASSTDMRALCSAGTSTQAIARPYFTTGPATEALRSLWNSPPNPSSKARGLQPALFAESTGRIGGISFTAHPLDHSIPGCVGYILDTSAGSVVYPGDLRMHGRDAESSLAFVEHLSRERPHLLICEGTRLSRSSQRTITEAEVAERINDIVRSSTGRLVIGDFGGRHIERLLSFHEAAKESGRVFVVTPKDAYLLEAIAAADPMADLISSPTIAIHDKLHARMDGWESALRQRHPGRMISTEQIRANLGEMLLAMSYWDCGELVDLDPARGTYIYSSSEAYSPDQRTSLWRLTQWLSRWNMRLYGFKWEGDVEGRPIFNDCLNSSGHISGPDLAWLLNEVKPEFVLPVHTTQPVWFKEVLKWTKTQVMTTSRGGLLKCA